MNGIRPFLLASSDTPFDLSIFNPASPQAGGIANLSGLVFAITGFILVLVEGILIYCLLRFRRRPGTSSAEPPQVYGSKPIEIAWTAAPALVVFVLILVTARTLWQVRELPSPPAPDDHTLFVTVVGHQWWWEYTYTSYNGRPLQITTANELHVPAARAVHLRLESADVCHSYWVPRLAGKTDLIPGRVNTLNFRTDQIGLQIGQCAEYCGTQHANMLLRVVVDPPEVFDKWLDEQAEPGVQDADAKPGRDLFCAQACARCHRIDGTSATGRFGPDLTHLMSRQTLAAGMIPNTPENLRDWVDDPNRIKPGCLMPGFASLGEQERKDIQRYLLTLR